MKNWYIRFAAMLLMGVAVAGFTSCEEDHSKDMPVLPPEPPKPLIVGSFTPVILKESPKTGAFGVEATWKDPANIPTLDLTLLGLTVMPFDGVLTLANGVLGQIYGGGLVQMDFNEDHSFAVKYHPAGDEVFSFLPTISTFPDDTPESQAIAGAIRYSTDDSGKFYISVARTLLQSLEQSGVEGICKTLDDAAKAFPELGLTATADEFTIAVKYKFSADGKELTIYLERATMLPWVKLINEYIVPQLPEEFPMDEVKLPLRAMVSVVLDGLFNQTTEVIISAKLKRL